VKKILRRKAVEAATGLPRSTLYQLMSQGKFPKPIQINERSVGWLEHEIAAWQAIKIAARDKKGKAA
jgi:prophage regulatory protein